jgi:signal transduction histidine kinase
VLEPTVDVRAVPTAPPDDAPRPLGTRVYRGRLFRKYLLLIMTLVTGALLASGGISLYFTYQETKAALANLQHEKALAAAARIEQYIRTLEQQLKFAALPQLDPSDAELRRIEFLKLLRQAPEVTDIAQISPTGREQVAVSRLGMDVVNSGRDRSREPAVREARRGQTWFGPVYFRKETEPYMTIAIRSGGDDGPVTVADVNLKFIWDVVSRIKIGDKGKAYVVDSKGFLVADPDIGLVLRKTNLSNLAHVKAALGGGNPDALAMVSNDAQGKAVLNSVASIDVLGWKVFVEQPVSEVYAKLDAAILRTGLLLLGGLAVSALGALALARGMVRPIRTLADGAQRIGAGELEQRIEVRTGDELEALADRFNTMSAQLRESYAGLERKVEERTTELKNALEQQTAISEILRVISGSPGDVRPMLDAVAERALKLCEAAEATIVLVDGDVLKFGACYGDTPTLREGETMLLSRGSATGRAVIDRVVIHMEDLALAPEEEYPLGRELQRRIGHHAILSVPLMREDRAIGAIALWRMEARRFTDKQVALIETFAQQAAIAIANVRLFNETKEALEQQTAISEILRVISGSPNDVQPVLDAIAERAARLCDAAAASIYLTEGNALRHLASQGPSADPVDHVETLPIDGRSLSGRALLDHRTIQVGDMQAEGAQYPLSVEFARRMGSRTIVVVPLYREGQPFGTILLRRMQVRRFTEREIGLLATFGDQAAIALGNVQLFREIEDKSRQLEIANKHKSEFLANMSHELRTPLNAIIGFSEVLLERLFGELNDKQDDYLKDIHTSGRHLLALINDILDLSKVEAGRMELELSTFDLAGAVSNAMTLIRERAQRHAIELAVDVDPQIGAIVADERKFKQILLNLLSNAVKFTPDGGRIDVAARRDGAEVALAVHDTGIGIAPADQDAVFEEFRQVGRDYTNKQEGTGLGLALTRKFVELHGGRIWLQSEPGKGSTFTFTIPGTR